MDMIVEKIDTKLNNNKSRMRARIVPLNARIGAALGATSKCTVFANRASPPDETWNGVQSIG